MSTPSLTDLVSKMAVAAAAIDSYIQTHNAPAPSFEASGPPGLPHAPEVAIAKLQLLELLADMTLLVQGPTESITLGPMQVSIADPVLDKLNADMRHK
jgi:hypothetical protein